jgi:hypothetical protein
MWGRVRIIHVPQYQTRAGYSDIPGRAALEIIPYAALVLQVEVLKGGELIHGSARCLEQRGWGLLIQNREAETVRFMKEARKRDLNHETREEAEKYADLSSRTIVTELGDLLEHVYKLAGGKTIYCARAALQAMALGTKLPF